MPRAGPRPYECVRRAWHSERHEAMRGSIIQQIFRVVSEAHSPATKKNREWKEKLPVVVLKAEEIMYSKANSEAEYLNLETLWERVNDAVDIIIRRDESNETGNLLPPCVEAALNLGCVPVRASRSQRHSNPRNYLTREQELPALTPTRPTSGPSAHLLNQSHHARPEKQNLGVLLPDSCSHAREAHKFAASCSSSGHLYDKSHHRSNQLRTTENDTLRNLGSVYPLYYGNQYRYPAENSSPLGLGITERARFDTILVGMPVGTSNIEPGKVGIFQSRLSHDSSEHTRNYHEYSPGTKCDLSLRLGRSSDPCVDVEGSSAHEDVGSVSLHEVNGLTESRVQLYRDICSFPRGSYYHQQQFK